MTCSAVDVVFDFSDALVAAATDFLHRAYKTRHCNEVEFCDVTHLFRIVVLHICDVRRDPVLFSTGVPPKNRRMDQI